MDVVHLNVYLNQCYKYRWYIGNIAIYRDVNSLAIYRQYIAPIFSLIFWVIFPIFSQYLTIFWRYLPIFRDICRFYGDICRYFRMCCDFLYFSLFLNIFVFFILPIYWRCLPTFSPIIPIISFWTLGDIFVATIFVTLRFSCQTD